MTARHRSRGLLLSRRAFGASLLAAPLSHALGRKPYGGVLRLELPFSVDALDVHGDGDVVSALFTPAIADPLFALDAQGRPYPALAASLPEATNGGARVTLRAGLVSARGKSLDARDVLSSLSLARRGAARALLAPLRAPVPDPGNRLAVIFPNAAPDAVADALASPAVVMVPRSASSRAPDGTGPFRAEPTKDLLLLSRNEHAARGPSFLERIEVRAAADLAGALRAFESGDADVGFLGAGLHRRRAGAVDFRSTPFGFVVLRTGPEARSWGTAGIAARLVDGIDPARLAPLGLGAERSGGDPGWGGAPADLLVDQGAPYLAEVARVVAGSLSRPGHEVRATPLPRPEHRARVATGKFSLAVDFVRALSDHPSPRTRLLALLTAADPGLADHPPSAAVNAEAVIRTLPLATLGELAIAGARAETVRDLDAWDLGSVTLRS